MNVQVYGCNHVAIEVGDIEKVVAFYEDVFSLKKLDGGEGDAFFQLGEHQFLAMFERKGMARVEGDHHFGTTRAPPFLPAMERRRRWQGHHL